MMSNIQSIQMTNPCQQSWANMTEAQGGRHCQSCCKTVTDFTLMSNQQIIDHLSASTNVCGRITAYQFKTINYQLKKQAFPPAATWWKRAMLAASFLLALQQTKAQSPELKHATEQIPPGETMGKVMVKEEAAYRTINGRVTDTEGEPLIGVSIWVDKNKMGTVTNANGEFTMRVPIKAKKIRVSYVGFETLEMSISKKADDPYKINLKMSAMMLGGLGAVKKPTMRDRFNQSFIVQSVRSLIG